MKKWLIIGLVSALVICSFLGFRFYQYIFKDNVRTKEATELYIPTDSKFDSLIDSLRYNEVLHNEKSFRWVAQVMKFRNVRSGKYVLQPEWNNKQLISHLRAGNQTPTDVTFNNVRTINELAGALAEKLEPDSSAFINYFLDPDQLDSVGLDSHTILTLFIPNTYEFYWNSTPRTVLKKLKREHDKFWTEDRRTKLEASGFSEAEVYTIASIVEKETNLQSEKSRIAGVYINRLKKDILLQADPTVVFATGNFSMRRVLNKHIRMDSPFNTYKNAGLPPGPICMPDISTIDATLNYEDHDFLYFCASPEQIGAHAFAKTLAQHNRNARIYRQWLNQNKIYK